MEGPGGGIRFRFDADQQYQLDAISSVVDLFAGTPAAGEAAPGAGDLAGEIGAVPNPRPPARRRILADLGRVQERNGLEVSRELAGEGLDFDVEMETGTGKIYVYLRIMLELAARYGFTKFVVLVPGVAVREGVRSGIDLMRRHLEGLYLKRGVVFDTSVYSGRHPERVRSFATSPHVQILVMTIDSICGARNTRIVHRRHDALNGLRPVDYLRAVRPVLVMDEPQNMESLLSRSSIGELDPVVTLRYSATHATHRNVVHRLDPITAHELGLVKRIVVADVHHGGADACAHACLVDVVREPRWRAHLEVSVRGSDSTAVRRLAVGRGRDLSEADVTDDPAYAGWRIESMSLDPPGVELVPHGFVRVGESVGASAAALHREMIRETIREHLRREVQLRPRSIKVLSLFFVDRVAAYLGGGTGNDDADGEVVRWFDELFARERDACDVYRRLLPQEPRRLRRAYFARLGHGRTAAFGDTSGTTRADDDAYELIMRDKERLLDEDEPVRFVFSHSALREGWDNPNVFQICTLRDMGGTHERRQTLGRGLRLPVARTPHGYERVADPDVATLTVVADESYASFAASLQKEYRDVGMDIGRADGGVPLHPVRAAGGATPSVADTGRVGPPLPGRPGGADADGPTDRAAGNRGDPCTGGTLAQRCPGAGDRRPPHRPGDGTRPARRARAAAGGHWHDPQDARRDPPGLRPSGGLPGRSGRVRRPDPADPALPPRRSGDRAPVRELRRASDDTHGPGPDARASCVGVGAVDDEGGDGHDEAGQQDRDPDGGRRDARGQVLHLEARGGSVVEGTDLRGAGQQGMGQQDHPGGVREQGHGARPGQHQGHGHRRCEGAAEARHRRLQGAHRHAGHDDEHLDQDVASRQHPGQSESQSAETHDRSEVDQLHRRGEQTHRGGLGDDQPVGGHGRAHERVPVRPPVLHPPHQGGEHCEPDREHLHAVEADRSDPHQLPARPAVGDTAGRPGSRTPGQNHGDGQQQDDDPARRPPELEDLDEDGIHVMPPDGRNVR